MKDEYDKFLEQLTIKRSKCKGFKCNHPLDPVEWDCGYNTSIGCDECKYSGFGGRKNPEAKCNQL